MTLTKHELTILQDTDFLLTKAVALDKVEALLLETRTALEEVTEASEFDFPPGTVMSGGKVSRGENYRGLPYRVLDQPALLTQDDIFALRTMFWWGHFFSVTLHLGGASLERFRKSLMEHVDRLAGGNIYISIGETPWEYHYGADNYTLLKADHQEYIANCSFLKLSRKMELPEWERLPRFAAGFLKELLSVLA